MASPRSAKTSTANVDSRLFPRASCQLPARLLVAPATEFSCTIMDVSEAGIGISISDALPPATNCMVSFDVIDDGTRRRVNAWGKVVYCSERAPAVRAGIQFMDMDSNSKLLLRRIPV